MFQVSAAGFNTRGMRTLFGFLTLTILSASGFSANAQNIPRPQETAAVNAGPLLPDAPMPTNRSAITQADDLLAGAVNGQLQVPAEPSNQQQSSSQSPQKQNSAPSLQDLGLSPDQTKVDPDLQARLDHRTHDLKVHQKLGLITLAPLAAACISSAAAPPDPRNGQGNTVGRDIHVSLGSLSAAMYGATAYYAIKAPRIPGEGPAKGGIKLHKYLIYIHAPGMILTPILGAMAFNQAADGQRVHGIASAHAAVAWTTVAAYSAAIVAVSWPIHLPGRKTP